MVDLLRFLSWYIAISVIGWLSFPIAFRFFPKLTSRGFALTKPLGLLLWGFAFWLPGSLGILHNNLGGVLLAFVLVLVLAWLAASKGKWQEMANWLRANKKTIITMEVLFLLAFATWTVVRAANPEVRYTEKPMELAFINAILRSPTLPPLDPWLSGYAISYYYFGYVLISMLVRVTGVASSVAFNLSASLWFGMTALAVYGVVFDLLSSRNAPRTEPDSQQIKKARIGGFLGPFFVLIVSCLEGALEFMYSWGWFWKADAQGGLTSRFWSWLAVPELDVAPVQFSSFPTRVDSYLWWRGSRVIQDLTLSGNRIEVIDEFPFFSYLLSDLHPHLLAMPFVLLAVAICLNVFFDRESLFFKTSSIIKWLAKWEFWLTALVLGSMAFLNTWDFPIYVGLFCLVVTYQRIMELGWGWSRVWDFIKTGLVIGITGVIIFLPFYVGFKSQAGGILPSMEYMTRGVHFWLFFGALLIPIIIWLIHQIGQIERPRGSWKSMSVSLTIIAGLLLTSLLFGILILGVGQTGTDMVESGIPWMMKIGAKLEMASAGFSGLHENAAIGNIVREALLRRLKAPGTWLTLLLMLAGVWTILQNKAAKAALQVSETEEQQVVPEVSSRQTRNFVALLILVGIGLTAFPEFFYLRDQFGWRMNTIFKFYFEAWILWGVVAAYASAELISKLKGIKAWLFNITWIVVLVCSLAYPTVMILNKTNNFNPQMWTPNGAVTYWTLDGNAYINNANAEEYAAMQWLNEQPLGVVAEAVGGSYSEFARISTRTGMPTVLGWPGHEGQWRGGYAEVGSRESDIETLYTTDDWPTALNIIQRYKIRYIYIGNTEMVKYQVNLEKFTQNLPLVYANNGVSIFEVPDEVGVINP